MPSFTVGGLASGLDTDAIITQLMSLERAPITKMKTDVSKLNQQRIAWNKLESLTKSITTKAQELASVQRLYAPATTSSNPDAVAVTGDAAAGANLSFTVSALARAGQSALTGFGSASDVIGAGTVTVATATGSKTITLGDGATLADMAAAVSTSGLATATVVNTGDPTLKTELLFTSTSTGTAAEASVTFTGFAQSYATSTVRAAADAQLQIGTQTITRGSNTIDDLVPGATVTLKQTTTDDVTISAARDDAAVATKVKEFVNAINSFLTDMKTYTKTDPTGDADGVLAGDPRLRTLNLSLMRSITNSYGTGETSLLSQVGVRVERDGSLSFNEATFTKALADDPDGVADLLTRSGTTASGQMSYVSAGALTGAGSYDVVVTAAATKATLTSPAFTTLPTDTDLTFTLGSTTATFTATAGTSGADLATGLSTWFTSQKLALSASYDGSALTVTAKDYGSAGSFEVTSPIWSGTGTGTDVAGSIGGVAATGSGQNLTAASTSAASGLTVRVTASGADVAAAGGALDLGAMTYNDGLGGVLNALFGAARDAGGLFPSALASLERADDRLEANISSMERRMEQREKTMRARFAALELALARMQSSTPDFSSLSTDIYSPKN